MDLYETLFKRRSVRKYENKKIDPETLSDILQYADGVKQIDGQSAQFEIVGSDALKGGMAPYALLAYGDDSDLSLFNVGYTMQGIDLYLQSTGFGSVWCGMAKPKQPKENYRILLGFGHTNVPLRNGENDFKRKKITDISNEDNQIARAARLAPSAVNFQPWKLRFENNKITISANVRGIGKILPGRLYLFDLGIITKFVEVFLVHSGNTITGFTFSGAGKTFAATVHY